MNKIMYNEAKRDIEKLQIRLDECKTKIMDGVQDGEFWYVAKMATEASSIQGKIEALRDIIYLYEYYNK